MAATDRWMSATRVTSSVITGHLAGLHLLHLLRRNERIEFLLRLLVDLLNLLLPLLGAERMVGANGFDFGARPLLDDTALLHGRLGDASHLPAGCLVIRRTSDRAGTPWQGLLHTNRGRLRRGTLA
jgi:hypothetical protein